MVNPTKGWDRIPVFGFYFKGDDVTPMSGTIKFTMTSRVTRVDGRRIYAEGAVITRTIGDITPADTAIRDAVRAEWRAQEAAAAGGSFDGAAWDAWWNQMLTGAVFASFPAGDDPDIVQTGYQVTVTETLTGGSGKVYAIEPKLSDLASTPPGINLGLVDVPPGTPTAPLPIYAKGKAGGVAALNSLGQVVDAFGNVVAGGGTSGPTHTPFTFVLSKPGPLAVAGGAARLPIPFYGTLFGARAAIGGVANAPVTADVNKNGTTVYTNANNRPSIATGQHDAQDPIAVNVPLVPGDYITVDVDSTGGQTAPTFVARTTAGGVFGQTVTATRPTGAAAGDVHVAFVWLSTGDAVGATSPAQTSLTAVPTGWALIGTGPTRNAYNANDRYLEQWMYWWRDDGTQSSWTWTAATPVSSSSYATVEILTYRGLKPTGSPVDVFATASPPASGGSWAAPSVIPTNATDLLVTNWMSPTVITTPTFPNVSTGRFGAATAPFGGFMASDRSLSSTDPTGAQTLTGSSTPTTRVVATTLALLPDPAAKSPGSDLTVVLVGEVTG